MIRSFAYVLGLCAVAAPTSAHEPDLPSQLLFHKVSAPGREILTVTVFLRQDRDGEPIWYQFRRSHRENADGEGRFAGWADTIRCPGSREALERLTGLQMPQPLVPGLLSNDRSEAIMDGWSYGLETRGDGPYRGSYLKLTADAGSPLASWIDDTLAILEPCWDER
jgi:hypothetical protein